MLPTLEAVLKAAKVPEDVRDRDAIAYNIMQDSEVRTLAMDAAIEAYLLEGIARVSSIERLHKRTGVQQAAPVKPKITWHIEQQLSGTMYILGKRDSETAYFTPPFTTPWFGEKIPQYVIDEFNRRIAHIQAQREADEAAKTAAQLAQKNEFATKPRRGVILLDDGQA